ncbi:hypothetical protein A2643_03885 [Candidatus Nomurabacteria bacterium RIFCSPHIGHO2_01_FULL_39_220]|uniref:Antitoxin, RHH family protein n=1 Tax=Candidatus Nomurabacteria bacterium RIFCSPLOWO2_02_FULL_40_67 TaxID=1801787 RepID=A0A1F6Y5K0_9BACT|nr:MAG: hypothetical protein A2W12_03455 [Candidatus Nomurabacteria bacterium RBG_16_40_11]OGI69746.1 MAG: hypothetical protein A2643_03885 [Candidatus Nomurabacteria bacterium RIFCSPHIGHO2_01_FULL_39_220]OGI72605.1 MAG: hypothetical protein A2W56_01460 [Candidatus Nomurabacteria bacterium RIFCSPHIGHO2_02_41_18]OGI78467.1 MAG: hypothetical protein A3C65_00645 [Candidatus Nomurabacteria bacterium RIFCSPHIGHO2_02_FULL_41_150]OGI81463.1 MAG: hypothetical protein A3E03_01680 [Candidatus Nomurabacte
MATIKKRVNISLSPSLNIMLSRIAKRDNMPQATKAVYLLGIALEIEEDMVLDKIASGRDTKNARFLSHKQAWA